MAVVVRAEAFLAIGEHNVSVRRGKKYPQLNNNRSLIKERIRKLF